MKKQLVVLAMILVLTGVSVTALCVYQDDVRSDVHVLTPGYLESDDYDAMVRLGDSNYWNVSLESRVDASCWTDSGMVCLISVTVSVNQDYVFETFGLRYSYVSDGDSLIPSDAASDQDMGPDVSRQYVDPVTGDTLLFRESGGMLESIRFNGTTVVGGEGDFEYAEFDLVVTYEPQLKYVSKLILRDAGDKTEMAVQGTENGIPVSGSLLISPMPAVVNSAAYVSERHILSLELSGTLIPQELLSVVMPANGGTINQMLCTTSYLRQDSTYIVPEIEYDYGVDEYGKTMFTMSGTVMMYHLDGDCYAISKETVEFDYEVV